MFTGQDGTGNPAPSRRYECIPNLRIKLIDTPGKFNSLPPEKCCLEDYEFLFGKT